MNKLIRYLQIAFLIFIASCSYQSVAQSISGEIHGYLGYIPNGTVIATELTTNQSYTTDFDESGLFSFSNLPQGKYTLLAIPDDFWYMETYYPSETDPESAYVITLTGKVFGIDLTLIANVITYATVDLGNFSEPVAFPNPVAETLYINTANNYKIVDHSGIEIQRGTNMDKEVNVSDWKSGLYLLMFSDGNTIKIFKQ